MSNYKIALVVLLSLLTLTWVPVVARADSEVKPGVAFVVALINGVMIWLAVMA